MVVVRDRANDGPRRVAAEGGLRWHCSRRALGQRLAELSAGADVELGEHLAQVPLDGARADEELGRRSPGSCTRRSASRAICASWAVSSSRVSAVCLRTVSPVASSSRRARSANAFGAHPAEHVMGEAELLARVHAPTLATQPLAVQEMGAGEMYGDTAAGEPLDASR